MHLTKRRSVKSLANICMAAISLCSAVECINLYMKYSDATAQYHYISILISYRNDVVTLYNSHHPEYVYDVLVVDYNHKTHVSSLPRTLPVAVWYDPYHLSLQSRHVSD